VSKRSFTVFGWSARREIYKKISKSLLVLLISWYGKNKKNALHMSTVFMSCQVALGIPA